MLFLRDPFRQAVVRQLTCPADFYRTITSFGIEMIGVFTFEVVDLHFKEG